MEDHFDKIHEDLQFNVTQFAQSISDRKFEVQEVTIDG